MRTIRKIFGYTMGLAVGLCAVACADENDWGVDSSYDRLFGIANDGLNVTEGDTWAEVTFEGFRGSEYFVIEVSTDSLTDEMEMGVSPNSIVYGEDQSITASPDTIRGLLGETKYFLRMKACSTTKPDSKWVYYDNGDGGTSFTTLAEQIFNTPTAADMGDTYMNLTWLPGAEVTRLTVETLEGTMVQDIDLTKLPDAVANGEYKVENLEQLTTYVFSIYNGDKKRGQLELTTAASMPDADYQTTVLATATVLSQEIIDQASEEALAKPGIDPTNYSVTIGIPAGMTLDVYGTSEDGGKSDIKIPDGMSVTFFGLAGGEAPVLKTAKCFDVSGKHAYVHFNNLSIVESGSSYVINQGKACSVGEISFEGVNVDGLKNSFVRFKDTDTKSLDKLLINDCIISNQTGGPVVYFKEGNTTLREVTVTNSTFDGCGNTIIHTSGSQGDVKITIASCTFYNIIGDGKYLIDAQNNNSEISISKSIFAKTATEKSKGVRNAGTTDLTEVYFTSDFVFSSNAIEPTVQLSESSTDVFADPANHDFTIQVRNVEVGDPRWLK